MKKLIILALLVIGHFFSSLVMGQTSTSSPSGIITIEPTVKIDKQIQDLKEKIASKVAEINKKDKMAYSGFITLIKDGSVFFKDKNDQEIEAKADDLLSKVYLITGATKKEIKLGDLKKDDFIIVSGILSGKSITVNSIYKDEKYFVKTGKISEVDKTDYFIKLTTSDKDNLTIDIETYTKIKLLNVKSLEIEKSGFSKIKEGDTIHFVYKKPIDPKEQNRFSAQTILIIPQEYFIK